MKKWGNFITLFLAICTFVATQALAAEQGVGKTPGVQAQTVEKPASTKVQAQAAPKAAMGLAGRVGDIMGKKAVSQKGEDLGEIEDLVLTKEGCVAFIVLEPKGWFGGGDRYIPIPWRFVKAEGEKIVISKDRSQLEKAPAIEKNKWPQYLMKESGELYDKILEFFGGEK